LDKVQFYSLFVNNIEFLKVTFLQSELNADFGRREVEKCLDFIKREVELLMSVLREMEKGTQKGGKSANQD